MAETQFSPEVRKALDSYAVPPLRPCRSVAVIKRLQADLNASIVIGSTRSSHRGKLAKIEIARSLRGTVLGLPVLVCGINAVRVSRST